MGRRAPEHVSAGYTAAARGHRHQDVAAVAFHCIERRARRCLLLTKGPGITAAAAPRYLIRAQLKPVRRAGSQALILVEPMPISPYVARLRGRIGHDLLLLPSVMGIIYDPQSRVLLVRQTADGLWSTPGGVIEPDESPATAVVREVQEETGLEVNVVRLLGVYGGPTFVVAYPNGDRSQYVSAIFECVVRGGAPAPDGDETDGVLYAGPGDIDRLPCQPWLQHVMPFLWRRSAIPFYQ